MGDSRAALQGGTVATDGLAGTVLRGRRPGIFLTLCGVTLLLAFSTAGCGGDANKKAALTDQEIERLTFAPKPTDSDELVVSGEAIKCEDIMTAEPQRGASTDSFQEKLEELAGATTLEQFTKLARPEVRRRLNSRITNIVLYRRAKRELGEKVDETLDNMSEKELRRFVLEHGGNNAQGDEALKAIGMNRSTFKEYKKKQILAEYSISTKLSKNQPITYSELVAAYDQMKDVVFVRPGLVQFRLIDIQAARVELADPNDDPVRAARALAESLVTRIIAGEDFGTLAEQYSHGFRRTFGGLWTPRDPASLAEPYTVLAGVTEKIEVGQIAGPIDVPGHAFIMKLEQKREKGYWPLADVQEQVEEKIRTDRRVESLRRLDAEVAEQTGVADTDQFLDNCLERLYRTVNPSSAP